jgi:hypothetical protein
MEFSLVLYIYIHIKVHERYVSAVPLASREAFLYERTYEKTVKGGVCARYGLLQKLKRPDRYIDTPTARPRYI